MRYKIFSILVILIGAVVLNFTFEHRRKTDREAAYYTFSKVIAVMHPQVEKVLWRWIFKEDKLYWDKRMRVIYGVNENFKPTYEAWLELVHPEDRERADQICTQHAEDGLPYSMAFRIVTPAGEVRHITEFAAIDPAVGEMIGINFIDRSYSNP